MIVNRVPALPEVERVVGDLVSEVVATEPSANALWHIWGPATAGKSTALHLLGERLAGQGLLPIMVSPPARTLDAGPIALVETAVGLKHHAQNTVRGPAAAARPCCHRQTAGGAG